ncbi:MAG: PAS domain S-box protein [Candidatus Thorarchaeota archaeon]|nr:PAS domain S-box protein [Candidatus Thorarchaeota archaeon]
MHEKEGAEQSIDTTPSPTAEQIYRTLFDFAPIPIVISDIKGNIIEANIWMLEEFGYSLKELQELGAKHLYEDPNARSEIAVRIGKERKLRDFEVRMKRKDGTTFPAILNVDPVQRGTAIINLTSIRDITKQRAYEKVLSRDRRANNIIAEAAFNTTTLDEVYHKVLVGLVDTLGFDLGTINVYEPESKLLILKASTGVGDDPVELSMHIDDESWVTASAARLRKPVMASDVTKTEYYKTHREKLDRRKVRSLISWPIIGAEDELLGLINIASRSVKEIGEEDIGFFNTVAGMFVTVLAQKQAEEELRESQELFQMFTDNMPGPVYIKDHESKVIFINKFMRMTGMNQDWAGKTNNELFAQKTAEERTIADRKVLEEGPIEEIQRMLGSDGSPVTYRRLKFPIPRDNRPPLIGGFSVDISEQVKAEEALEAAKDRAEFFTDLMAHDINNIHQGVMASLELLLTGYEMKPEARELTQNALNQIHRGVALIANVRKFSQLGEEKAKLTKTELATEILTAKQVVIQSFPHKMINVDIKGLDSETYVEADGFLRDAFFNIMHNSAKFDISDKPQIDISIKKDDKENFVVIEISDHGSGISDEQKEKVFTRLQGRTQRSSGIGLTLVKQIIDRYRGSIKAMDRIEGDYTKGVKFEIRIPRVMS